MNKIIALVCVVITIGFVFFAIDETTKSQAPFVTSVSKLESMQGKLVQFIGSIVKEKTSLSKDSSMLIFQLRDKSGKLLDVTYKGTKPAGFDTADKVLVRGHYMDGTFEAENVFMTYPKKYHDKADVSSN